MDTIESMYSKVTVYFLVGAAMIPASLVILGVPKQILEKGAIIFHLETPYIPLPNNEEVPKSPIQKGPPIVRFAIAGTTTTTATSYTFTFTPPSEN